MEVTVSFELIYYYVDIYHFCSFTGSITLYGFSHPIMLVLISRLVKVVLFESACKVESQIMGLPRRYKAVTISTLESLYLW